MPARSHISTAFLVTVVRNGEAPVIVEATGNGVSASLFRTIDVKVRCLELRGHILLVTGRFFINMIICLSLF